MVNTSALESRGRGFKSRSRQFLEFHLRSFISFFHWFQFICVMYICIYIYMLHKKTVLVKKLLFYKLSGCKNTAFLQKYIFVKKQLFYKLTGVKILLFYKNIFL